MVLDRMERLENRVEAVAVAQREVETVQAVAATNLAVVQAVWRHCAVTSTRSSTVST